MIDDSPYQRSVDTQVYSSADFPYFSITSHHREIFSIIIYYQHKNSQLNVIKLNERPNKLQSFSIYKLHISHKFNELHMLQTD